jgi:hypothetical protein
MHADACVHIMRHQYAWKVQRCRHGLLRPWLTSHSADHCLLAPGLPQAMLFLINPKTSSYMTGQTLLLDGGMSKITPGTHIAVTA